MPISYICTTLLLLLVPFPSCEPQKIGNHDRFIPASPPTNLSVTASVFNLKKHQLQLNILWTPHTEGHSAESYNVHVWTLNNTNEICRMEEYYNFIQNGSASSCVVHPGEDNHDENAFRVIPSCAYQIRLEANPHNGKLFTEINYTVPECVGAICSCKNSDIVNSSLLELNVQQIHEKTVMLNWSVAELVNISSFILRVGPKHLDGSESAVYKTIWSKEVPVLTNSNNTKFDEIYQAENYGKYIALIRTVDYKKCVGPETRVIFEVQNLTEPFHLFSKSEIFFKLTLPFGVVIVTVCILLITFRLKLFYWIKKRKLSAETRQSILNKGIFYSPVKIRSQKVFRRSDSLQQRNILYVEKEIEEAKNRGEVDGFEISYNRLTFEREIGRGAFGQVFLARAEAIRGSPETRLVAVKKLKAKAGEEEREEFLEEIAMLKRVGQHPNVVSLLACVTLQTDLCMVMEYIPCGDLRKYLRHLRNQVETRKPSVSSMSDKMYSSCGTASTGISSQLYATPKQDAVTDLDCALDHRELHSFAHQIASGMEHLEMRRITHRDLAARNILIDNNKVLKISDFGLSRRGVYVNTRRCKVPLRWLSVESMTDALYSSKSDVWAFAIVLWEIGTLGGFPYPMVSDTDLLFYLKRGNRLEKPEIVSQDLYSMMLVCWSENPEDRPTFRELVAYLEPKPNLHIYVEFPAQPQLPPAEYVNIEEPVASSATNQ